MNCPTKDLLLDFVFDLLDEPQAASLREHLAGCPTCQSEWKAVQLDQRKIAQAALAITDVPPFALSADEASRIAAPPSTPASEAPSPPASEPSPRRSSFPRLGGVVALSAVACALLVAVLFTIRLGDDHSTQESEIADLTRQRDAIDSRIAALQVDFAAEQTRLPERLGRESLQLHVAGPGAAVPAIRTSWQVALRDLDDRPQPGEIDFEFRGPNDRVVSGTLPLPKGTGELVVPADMPAGATRLKIVGRSGDGKDVVGSVEEPIDVREPALAAHLATNKSFYRAGDRIHARALVLDRLTLRPAADGTPVAMSLVDAQGRERAPVQHGKTIAGVAAVDLAAAAPLGEGTYTVHLRGDKLIPVSRNVDVLPSTPPNVEVIADRNQFKPGEPIEQSLRLFNGDGTPAANTPIFGSAAILEQQYANPGPAAPIQQRATPLPAFNQLNRSTVEFEGRTDDQGRYTIKLPGIAQPQTGRQQLQADISYGAERKARARVVSELQVRPADPVVDLYPQGGRLVAGAANPVYFRVRAPEGDDTVPARFALEANGVLVFDSKSEVGVGSFTIVPDPKATYSVKLLSPKQSTPAQALPLPIDDQGVLLGGETVQSGAALDLNLDNRGPDRLLQLVATSRGQVVGHARIVLGKDRLAAKLPVAVDGVVRVTAVEVKDGRLIPLAERLFFLAPTRTLGIAVSTEQQAVAAKKSVALRVQGIDEQQRPIDFVGLASCVDARFLSDPSEPSPAAEFLFLGDDLPEADFADIAIAGGDISSHRLDLALNVFGWRRVGEPQPSPQAQPRAVADARAKASDAPANRPKLDEARRASSTPTFFHRVVPSLFEARRRHDERWRLAQLALVDAANLQRTALLEQRETVSRQLAVARSGLEELESLPRQRMLDILGAAALALLALGSLGMLYGLSLVLRRRPSTATFAAACVCLAVCLVLIGIRPEPTPGRSSASPVARAKPPVDFEPRQRPLRPAERRDHLAQADARIELEHRREIAPLQEHNAAAPQAAGLAQVDVLRASNESAARQAAARSLDVRRDGNSADLGVAPNQAAKSVRLESSAGRYPKTAGRDAKLSKKVGGVSGAGAAAAPAREAVRPQADAAAATPLAPAIPSAHSQTSPPPSADDRLNLGALPRVFAPRGASLRDPATIFWHPALPVPAAGATIPLDLPPQPASYQILLYGHTPDGRLGLYRGILHAK